MTLSEQTKPTRTPIDYPASIFEQDNTDWPEVTPYEADYLQEDHILGDLENYHD